MESRKDTTMLKDYLRTVHKKLMALNFYASPSSDLCKEQTGRWATRLYLVLLLSFTVVFTFYSSLTYNIETVIIQQPTLDTFLALQSAGKQSLSCPCKQISILRSSMISFAPKFHQFCSSDFLSDHWFNFLTAIEILNISSDKNNWRWGILVRFRFLEAMCNFTASIVNDAVRTFGQQSFVTAAALDPAVFDSQTTLLTRALEHDTATSFSRALDLIIINKRFEQTLNVYKTNVNLQFNNYFVSMSPMLYNNNTCECAKKATCVEQTPLAINNNIVMLVPGWYMGCFIIDSLMQSTFECYYNQDCIDSIYAAHLISNWGLIQWNITAPRSRPLDATRATMSRFPLNATIGDCIECQPIQCFYTERVRKNFITIVTTIIAALGGLSTALNILVPNTVRFLRGPIPKFFSKLYPKIRRRRIRVSTVDTVAHSL
ncbi:unnamed protein product [Adineta ricciae]|uniref:Uncharacterized protein n=1 Tax=Adineta ricciae TaxID=249248 RepID=A0A816BF95_ADIRI|nr:unnamed protein product [Adineta ricciae]